MSQNNQVVEKKEEDLSHILDNIKDVVTNGSKSPNTDILELTEKVQENIANDAMANDMSKKVEAKIMDAKQSEDILEKLDKVQQAVDGMQSNQMGNANIENDKTGGSTFTPVAEGLIDKKILQESKQTLKNFIKATEKHDVENLAFRSGTTVEDIVIELIKPQLSAWLNNNLPQIVNHIVQKEIKKLIPTDE
jgi:cell pole-organizing protein PopZ